LLARVAITCLFIAALRLDVGAEQKKHPISVSLIQLLATPERYEGRRVRVIGYCHLAFEEQALYLHKEDADTFNERNGVWLGLDDATATKVEALHQQFVLVEGTFTGKVHGHLGAWPAALTGISRIERSPTRAEIRSQRRLSDRQ
jgi:hypothetical protein